MRFLLHGAGVYAAIIALLLIFGGEGLQRAILEMATAAPYALAIIIIAIYVAVLCAMQAIGLDGTEKGEERRTRYQEPKEPEKKPRTAKKQDEKAPTTRRTGKRTQKTTAKKPAQTTSHRGGRKR